MDQLPPEALLAPYPPGHQAVANALRRLVKRAVPEAIERVRTGWGVIGYDVPIGRTTRLFAFVWPEPEHVHLGFQHGVLMEDPDGLLQGAGVTKRVRWLTLVAIDEIPPAAEELLREAARLAAMSRGERVVLLIDREEDPASG
jgi:nucleotide-binding universal stress UspA family protein